MGAPAPWIFSQDVVESIAVSDWLGPSNGFFTAFVFRVPINGQFVLEFLGTTTPLSAGLGGIWGIHSRGQPIQNYGRLPGATSIGTVVVPILTARTVIGGGDDVTLATDTVPGDPVQVRIRGTETQRPAFRDPRPPQVSRLDQVLGIFGVR